MLFMGLEFPLKIPTTLVLTRTPQAVRAEVKSTSFIRLFRPRGTAAVHTALHFNH